MIVEYIVNHQAEFWLACGFIMMIIEVISGFTAGIFLFAGLGALTTGILMMFGVLPQTWIAGLASTGISSGIIATLLWRPFRKLQGNHPTEKDNSSDLVGHEFILDSDISVTNPGKTLYSGINWKVLIDHQAGVDTMQAGQRVIVTSVEVATFKVKLAE